MILAPSIIEDLTRLAVQIQQIPAATFHEEQRAKFILEAWRGQGITDAWMDDIGNVYACIRGTGRAACLVVSAHLDTVFPMDADLSFKKEKARIFGPGIGDNSLGLAGLFGIASALNGVGNKPRKQTRLKRDVWLVANVCEEGLGDLKGIKSVVDHFGSEPAAYLVLEGMSLGQIYNRGLGVRRYRISVKTPGGHSWIDYGSPSAIHELAELIVKIKDISLPEEPRTSINIGTITGGTSVNTIASDASCELDLRSVNHQGLDHVIKSVIGLVDRANQAGGEIVRVQVELIGDRPTGEIPVHHPLVQLAVECHQKNGIKPKLTIGSTDANIPLSQSLPSICVGLTTGGGAHTLGEYIDIPPLQQGLSTVIDLLIALDNIRI